MWLLMMKLLVLMVADGMMMMTKVLRLREILAGVELEVFLAELKLRLM